MKRNLKRVRENFSHELFTIVNKVHFLLRSKAIFCLFYILSLNIEFTLSITLTFPNKNV